jgi:hypothetical protein
MKSLFGEMFPKKLFQTPTIVAICAHRVDSWADSGSKCINDAELNKQRTYHFDFDFDFEFKFRGQGESLDLFDARGAHSESPGVDDDRKLPRVCHVLRVRPTRSAVPFLDPPGGCAEQLESRALRRPGNGHFLLVHDGRLHGRSPPARLHALRQQCHGQPSKGNRVRIAFITFIYLLWILIFQISHVMKERAENFPICIKIL